MSNVLMLVSQYTGVANANGICTRNIGTELKKKGHQVTVLCYENGVSEEDVYTIPIRKRKYEENIIVKIGKSIGSFLFPILDKEKERNFKSLAISLCDEKKIDVVVCVFFPLETVTVMKEVKKRFPHITTMAYELDSVGDGIFASSRFKYFATLAYEHWSRNIYRFADKVIIMKSHEDYWKRVWGRMFENKLLIADIPVLLDRTLTRKDNCVDSPTVFLYSGLLGQKYRSPDYLLSVIDMYSKRANVVLDFYTRGDCENIIATFRERNTGIRQHGYVPESVLEEAITCTDILVSIGNRVSRSVPSKLIMYLSYGKPIVHFSSQKDDVCIQYLSQYPLGLVLFEWDSVEESVSKLNEFTKKVRGKSVGFSEIENAMRMNTPAYSADLIINNIERI